MTATWHYGTLTPWQPDAKTVVASSLAYFSLCYGVFEFRRLWYMSLPTNSTRLPVVGVYDDQFRCSASGQCRASCGGGAYNYFVDCVAASCKRSDCVQPIEITGPAPITLADSTACFCVGSQDACGFVFPS